MGKLATEKTEKVKVSAFIIFVVIVMTIYGLANYYIFYRGMNTFPPGTSRTVYIFSFWILAACFVASRFLERSFSGPVIDVMSWVGAFWLALLLYSFLYILVIDTVRIFVWISHTNVFAAINPQRLKSVLFFSGILIVTLVVTAGFINAKTQRHKHLDLAVNKVVQGTKTLKIAVATDIHLGRIIGLQGTKKLVRMINEIKPDIILLAGDVVDEDLMPVIKQNLGERLTDLSAPLGVWAITGNHEYIGGVEKAVNYLEEHGIKFLRDTSILVDGRFYLVGREDRDITRFTGKKRKTLEDVLVGVDKKFPVIMMDHQPFDLLKVSQQGVDIQISGHTHHGQMWPFNYLTKAIYEISWGYKMIGSTHFYVSSGFGSWGPPVRLGNYPEVIEINVTFLP